MKKKKKEKKKTASGKRRSEGQRKGSAPAPTVAQRRCDMASNVLRSDTTKTPRSFNIRPYPMRGFDPATIPPPQQAKGHEIEFQTGGDA